MLVTLGMSSDAEIITVDADPLPLRNEEMLESQGAIDHLPAAIFNVTMTGLGTIRLTILVEPSGY